MTNSPRFGCRQLLVQAYTEARNRYDSIALTIDAYTSRLISILRKRLGEHPSQLEIGDFLGKTATDDLYLSTACAQGNEAAWEEFVKLYGGFISRIANHACSNPTIADELANNTISDLFAPDRSHRPRIASYEGQSSLAAWLRVIVIHRALDERDMRWNSVERIDDFHDLIDARSLERIEASARAGRYNLLISDTLKRAAQGLTNRERYILLMIYGESLQGKEVARLLGVHPSRVSRMLRHICRKIREEASAILAQDYQLSEEAIEECLAEIAQNPEHSLVDFLDSK